MSSYITKILFSPITHLADARFAAAAGIEYLGFCLNPSHPNFILPIKAKEILDWISGSHAVAYFGEQSVEEIIALSELLNMDIVALENNLLPDELPSIGKPIIKVIDITGKDTLYINNEFAAYHNYADAFELKGSFNENVSIEFIKGICAQYKVFLSVDFKDLPVRETLLYLQPYAFMLETGEEEKTGLKEYDELNEFLEKLKL